MGSSQSILKDSTSLDTEYDYVIVGGGTAGCVLANRLSEDPAVTVLLIEAGKSHRDELFSKIPLTFGKLFKGQQDWNYQTTKQPLLHDRSLYWPRGKLLGGSSSINAMMFHHCAPQDFDEWTSEAPGWSYATLQPYFRKSEKYTAHILHPDVDKTHRGAEGVWHTGHPPRPPACDDILESFKAVGVPYNPDFNTPKGTMGANHFPGFVDSSGQRSSAATAYISPILTSRKNLTIAILTTTTRLIFASDSPTTVIGVEIARTPPPDAAPSDERWIVKARREVILSAGAINTPHLLMLSGIGTKDELEKHEIKIVKELSQVGKNLWDHLMTGAISFRAKPKTSLDYLGTPTGSLIPLVRWLLIGGGYLSALVGAGAAFVRSDDTSLPWNSETGDQLKTSDETSGKGAPDIEILWAPMAFLNHGFQQAPPGVNVLSLAPTLLRPKSHGTVTLASGSPFDKPIIDAKYLSEPNDLKVLVKAVRLSLHVARSEPFRSKLDFKEQSKDKSDLFWLGDADPNSVADEDLGEWIKNNCETLYHPVGTARMGTSSETSVINPSLRVHGVQNLRVVDASIFPFQLSGHPTAPIIAIAEKAADMIKSEYDASKQ